MGEGSGTVGEAPVPAALLLGPVWSCCPVQPCHLGSPHPLHWLHAWQGSSPSEHPCPAAGLPCRTVFVLLFCCKPSGVCYF